MAKPYVHAKSSARQFGGIPDDYIEIHNFLDCSKGTIADNRHRALTHNAWFLSNVLERVKFANSCDPTPDNRFPTIINSDGNEVSVREIGEQHVLEDYRLRYIPSAQDFLQEIEFQPWMNNGLKGAPPSFAKVAVKEKTTEKVLDSD